MHNHKIRMKNLNIYYRIALYLQFLLTNQPLIKIKGFQQNIILSIGKTNILGEKPKKGPKYFFSYRFA